MMGLPIGSGAVESSHKQVVQSRMKQAGMRWAEHHVDSSQHSKRELVDCLQPRYLKADREATTYPIVVVSYPERGIRNVRFGREKE